MGLPVKIKRLLTFGLPILLALGVKTLVWSPDITPFNADEAIVAIMARHINQGELPSFFYGQHYMGSLDAILTAILYRVFGESVGVIRFLQSALFLGTVFTTVLLAKRILRSERGALYAGLLVAIPPVNVTLYTTVSLGGYGEMLLLGNILLLGALNLLDRIQDKDFIPDLKYFLGLLLWGIGAGFSFWVIGLSLVYSIPALLFIGWNFRKKSWKNLLSTGAVLLTGFTVGSAPWWAAGLSAGNTAILFELMGGAIAGATQGSWLLQPMQRIMNLIIFGGTVITGLRPPWNIKWLVLPMLPFVLIFWLSVFVYSLKRVGGKGGRMVLPSLMGVVLSLGFIFTPYGDDPSGRYFLPLILPMALFGADMITNQLGGRRGLEIGLLLVVLGFNWGGTMQSRMENPPGLTTQFDPVAQVDHHYMPQLLSFLKKNSISTGYSNYWVSYPLAFLSAEEIIFSPRLPYHQDFRYTSRDDRYPAYTEVVRTSSEIAYITSLHPALDEYLQNQFHDLEISWQEKKIGDYTVYYDLSAPVHVWEIGLGETTTP